MLEAYRIGIMVSLTNRVSGVLNIIARDFMRAEGSAAAFKAQLRDIQLLTATGLMAGAAGYIGLRFTGAILKPAKEYADQLAQLNILGMTHQQVAEGIATAWRTTSAVMTTTAAQNIAAIRELRQVFGGTDQGYREALENLPTVQKIQAVLAAATGGRFGQDQAYTVAKAIELKGGTRDPTEFATQANLMTKAIVGSGEKVTPQDFQQAFKYGRGATAFWSDEFTYKVLPTLIQEMKSAGGAGQGTGGPGAALASVYRAIVGGVIPQKNLEAWSKLGLIDRSKVVWTTTHAMKGLREGGIKGWEIAQHDPYKFATEILLPAAMRAGYTTAEQQSALMAHLFGSQLAQFVMQQMVVQAWKFKRDIPIYESAEGTEAYQDLLKTSPTMAFQALASEWDNFKTALGKSVMPIIVPAINRLSWSLNVLATWADDHPGLAGTITATAGALSAAAGIFSVGILSLAAIRGIGMLAGVTSLTTALRAASGAAVALGAEGGLAGAAGEAAGAAAGATTAIGISRTAGLVGSIARLGITAGSVGFAIYGIARGLSELADATKKGTFKPGGYWKKLFGAGYDPDTGQMTKPPFWQKDVDPFKAAFVSSYQGRAALGDRNWAMEAWRREMARPLGLPPGLAIPAPRSYFGTGLPDPRFGIVDKLIPSLGLITPRPDLDRSSPFQSKFFRGVADDFKRSMGGGSEVSRAADDSFLAKLAKAIVSALHEGEPGKPSRLEVNLLLDGQVLEHKVLDILSGLAKKPFTGPSSVDYTRTYPSPAAPGGGN
ncbi:MAG: hypothetical protein ACLQME_12560 [Alphaproteobacteria bacterium]